MDPQDVPYSFNCTAHTTDLTPMNLRNKPVNTTRELSLANPSMAMFDEELLNFPVHARHIYQMGRYGNHRA